MSQDNTMLRRDPKPKRLNFICHTCRTVTKFWSDEDPTTSTGCCKICGSSHWEIQDLSGQRVE